MIRARPGDSLQEHGRTREVGEGVVDDYLGPCVDLDQAIRAPEGWTREQALRAVVGWPFGFQPVGPPRGPRQDLPRWYGLPAASLYSHPSHWLARAFGERVLSLKRDSDLQHVATQVRANIQTAGLTHDDQGMLVRSVERARPFYFPDGHGLPEMRYREGPLFLTALEWARRAAATSSNDNLISGVTFRGQAAPGPMDDRHVTKDCRFTMASTATIR